MAGAKLLIVACATTTGHNLKKFKKQLISFHFRKILIYHSAILLYRFLLQSKEHIVNSKRIFIFSVFFGFFFGGFATIGYL